MDLKTQVQILKKFYYTDKPKHKIRNPEDTFLMRELNECNEVFRKSLF